MPGRVTPIVTGEIYHVFNRGIDHRLTFTGSREFARAMEVITYYLFSSPPMRLSKFLKLSNDERSKIMTAMITKTKRLIDILSFCLMPNHFHFLLKQIVNNGIPRFVSNFENSYTRYFNTKHERTGPLFLDQFKAVRIETDEQLLHISRYIHLNPYTSYVVKDFESLNRYPWSSFPEYLEEKTDICEKKAILGFFKNSRAYERFVFDQTDYQRKLHAIQHLLLK